MGSSQAKCHKCEEDNNKDYTLKFMQTKVKTIKNVPVQVPFLSLMHNSIPIVTLYIP